METTELWSALVYVSFFFGIFIGVAATLIIKKQLKKCEVKE